METILQYAQGLVYSLVCLMPSPYQKKSLKALFGLFLEQQGHALPEHTSVKSASSLSRFLNHYNWPTRRVIRTTRQAVLQQLLLHSPYHNVPVRILIDLTTLPKTGKFVHLSTPRIDYPLTLSWFWLKRADGKRELRFVISTHPYSGVYLVRLGRKRWAIEGFFKTVKHQFGLHCFGQNTKVGIYRWLILSLIAYLLAHWIIQWSWPPILSWKNICHLTEKTLLPSIAWLRLLRHIREQEDVAAHYGFQITLNSLPDWSYKDWCKI